MQTSAIELAAGNADHLNGIARTPRGAEAAMKTYLLGALFGILLLVGVTLLYGVSATTSYAELADCGSPRIVEGFPMRLPGLGPRCSRS